MKNLGELVQFELTSHFNELNFCPVFRSQMVLEACLAWHNFFIFFIYRNAPPIVARTPGTDEACTPTETQL
jgi:hypothetical protein